MITRLPFGPAVTLRCVGVGEVCLDSLAVLLSTGGRNLFTGAAAIMGVGVCGYRVLLRWQQLEIKVRRNPSMVQVSCNRNTEENTILKVVEGNWDERRVN